MSQENLEYARGLGLLAGEYRNSAEEQDKKTALRYLMSGADIPQTLLNKIENYKVYTHADLAY